MNRLNIYFKKWKLFSLDYYSCKHHRYDMEVYETLYGHGLMCMNCKKVVTYEKFTKEQITLRGKR